MSLQCIACACISSYLVKCVLLGPIETYENSVVFVDFHLASMALVTGVGTGYSAMKLPRVSLTRLVIPRLIVCLRLHAVSVLFEAVDRTDGGRAYGSPYALGSTLLLGVTKWQISRSVNTWQGVKWEKARKNVPRWVKTTHKVLVIR